MTFSDIKFTTGNTPHYFLELANVFQSSTLIMRELQIVQILV